MDRFSQEKEKKYLAMVITLASENVKNDAGGPFAALIVKEDRIIAKGVNRVTKMNDPTAHAEIQAIRKACKKERTYILSDCTLYASCEPCPMCCAAIYWTRIPIVIYTAPSALAAAAGFSDQEIYNELAFPAQRKLCAFHHIECNTAEEPFLLWKNSVTKKEY